MNYTHADAHKEDLVWRDRLVALRKDVHHLSQSEMAEKLGVSLSAIKRYERGDNRNGLRRYETLLKDYESKLKAIKDDAMTNPKIYRDWLGELPDDAITGDVFYFKPKSGVVEIAIKANTHWLAYYVDAKEMK